MSTSKFARIDQALSERKILTLDIERLPGLARIWDQKTSWVPVSTWTRLPSLLSVSARWYGKREFMFRAAWDDPQKMIADVWDWLDQADILYTFNGDRFDIPHLRGAFLTAGLSPPSSYKSVDLFKVAKKFGFESKSLVHLCRRLGLPGKAAGHYDAELAEAAMLGDAPAQRKMRIYNNQDVKITEMCADAMRPWISTHPNLNTDPEKLTCNACGSDKLERNGTTLAVVMEYAEYRCTRCGAPVKAAHVRRVARGTGIRS